MVSNCGSYVKYNYKIKSFYYFRFVGQTAILYRGETLKRVAIKSLNNHL